jgi:hypothetical protein
MKSGRRSLLAFGITAGVLTVAGAAIAIPGFRKMAILDRESQAKERLRSGTGPTPGYVLVATPLGKQAVPEVYGETGRYTFFTHPEHGVLKLDLGGKPVERIPSDEELGIRRAPRK